MNEELGINKELQMGPPYRNIDYFTDQTSVNLDDYLVGISAFAREPGRLPIFFVAKTILVHCSQACFLRFNNANALDIPVPANNWMTFDVLLSRLYYIRDTVNGTLRVWFQG